MLAPFISQGRAQVRVVEDGTLEDLARALVVDTYDIVHLCSAAARKRMP